MRILMGLYYVVFGRIHDAIADMLWHHQQSKEPPPPPEPKPEPYLYVTHHDGDVGDVVRVNLVGHYLNHGNEWCACPLGSWSGNYFTIPANDILEGLERDA